MHLSIACPRVPPPPPPGRWRGFDQGWGQIHPKTPPQGQRKWSNSPTPGAGNVRNVCTTRFIESATEEHTQITVQTDDGQCAQPPESTLWSNSPPRVKRSGQIPRGPLGGGGTRGLLGALRLQKVLLVVIIIVIIAPTSQTKWRLSLKVRKVCCLSAGPSFGQARIVRVSHIMLEFFGFNAFSISRKKN